MAADSEKLQPEFRRGHLLSEILCKTVFFLKLQLLVYKMGRWGSSLYRTFWETVMVK